MVSNVNKKDPQKSLSKEYEPKTLAEFRNQVVADQIKEWICSYENKTSAKKGLIIHGESGIGKTLLINLLSKAMKYCMYYFDSSISRNKKWVQESLGELMNSKSFFIKHRLIVVDDMDAFTNTNDFGGITEIVKLINPLKGSSSLSKMDKLARDSVWKIPIIFICNNIKSNKFTELVKECDSIHFPVATNDELYKIAKKCKCLKKNIWTFIPHCRGDVRFFLNNIQFYKSDITVEKEDVNQFLYDRLSDMFEQPYNGDNLLLHYYNDTTMFPSLINENIYSNMDPGGFDYVADIADIISSSDEMCKTMYNKHYDVDDMYAYMSVITPIYFMKQAKSRLVDPIKFPVVLGKNAIIFANKLALRSFYNSKIDENIHHFCLLRTVILSLLNNEKTLKCGIKVMLWYNIPPDAVFSSVKVKIFNNNEYKNVKNVKYKKLIKSTYHEMR